VRLEPAERDELVGEGQHAGQVQELVQGLVPEPHVKNHHHFVLLMDALGTDAFTVHDPFYPDASYPYANISDIIMYSIQSEPWVNEPKVYPAFKQCDSTWGSDVMINETVCQVGCLMSSVSMALNGFNVSIDGASATPGTFNRWLRTHSGYDDDNGLNEEVVPNLAPGRITWPVDGMHRTNDLDMAMIRGYLLRRRVVIANVLDGRHFVLVTGFDWADPSAILVHDPGFNTTRYHYSDVVGWRIFDMALPSALPTM